MQVEERRILEVQLVMSDEVHAVSALVKVAVHHEPPELLQYSSKSLNLFWMDEQQ